MVTSNKEGGLGIREPHLLNLALGAKIVWNLFTHKKEWWAKVIIKKYLQGNHAQNDPENWKGKGSPIWNLIKISAPLILNHLTNPTRNGKSLKIWDHITKDSEHGLSKKEFQPCMTCLSGTEKQGIGPIGRTSDPLRN